MMRDENYKSSLGKNSKRIQTDEFNTGPRKKSQQQLKQLGKQMRRSATEMKTSAADESISTRKTD